VRGIIAGLRVSAGLPHVGWLACWYLRSAHLAAFRAAVSVNAMAGSSSHSSTAHPLQVGVAMGNAGPRVAAVADVVVSSNDEDGVAEAIRRFVLEPRGAAAAADVAAAR
jgi:hypothetical protein